MPQLSSGYQRRQTSGHSETCIFLSPQQLSDWSHGNTCSQTRRRRGCPLGTEASQSHRACHSCKHLPAAYDILFDQLQLRPDAPEFTPPGLSPVRAKDSRPAADPPAGSADRAAKRPRTSDAVRRTKWKMAMNVYALVAALPELHLPF